MQVKMEGMICLSSDGRASPKKCPDALAFALLERHHGRHIDKVCFRLRKWFEGLPVLHDHVIGEDHETLGESLFFGNLLSNRSNSIGWAAFRIRHAVTYVIRSTERFKSDMAALYIALMRCHLDYDSSYTDLRAFDRDQIQYRAIVMSKKDHNGATLLDKYITRLQNMRLSSIPKKWVTAYYRSSYLVRN